MIFGSQFFSVLVLVFAAAVLAYTTFSFAHVKITDADMEELDRLRAEGLLPASADTVADFKFLRKKISDIAPAVYLRQELWLHLYFYVLRVSRWFRPSAWLDRELHRLHAHQAHHYRVALVRLHALQYPEV
ncbi:MAG: hypothetical protein ACRD1E_06845 [Terriglobales bacterium]